MEAKEKAGGIMVEDQPDSEKKVHKVVFLTREGDPIEVDYEPGRMPYREHGREGSLLDIALNYGIELEHACGGNCACTTCHVIVKQGEENLSEMDDDEEDRVYMADGVTLRSRLGCQAVVKGDVTVEIAD
ncbi:MAG TPA: 2Fe-2S iron-sulfur cluster-binding protein [Blastocatellia bacterium]|nr:2Fe-2S iron-sulfur cluster-binding protein [Blastocatellia bacterium]